jgi:hypothetical protein
MKPKRSPPRTTTSGRIVYNRKIHYFSENDVKRLIYAWADLDRDPVGGALRVWELILRLLIKVLKTDDEKRVMSRWTQLLTAFAGALVEVSASTVLEPLQFIWALIRAAIAPDPTVAEELPLQPPV